jgi:hypothetical protein
MCHTGTRSYTLDYSTMTVSYAAALMTISIILLFHAAYSCLHYRELLRDLDVEPVPLVSIFSTTTTAMLSSSSSSLVDVPPVLLPPFDVWMEVMLSFFILLLSEMIRTESKLYPLNTQQNYVSSSRKNGRPIVVHQPLIAPPYHSRDFDIYTTRMH